MSLGLFGLIFAHFGLHELPSCWQNQAVDLLLKKNIYMVDEIRILYVLGLQRCARVTVER